MKITLRAKEDVIALMEEFKRLQKDAGNTWADTTISEAALNDRNFIQKLHRWKGGPQSPTMQRLARFEEWLRQQIGEEAYNSFRTRRASEIAGK